MPIDVGTLITEAMQEQKQRDSIKIELDVWHRNQAELWVVWARQPGNLPCR